jgi:hypothetical protein
MAQKNQKSILFSMLTIVFSVASLLSFSASQALARPAPLYQKQCPQKDNGVLKFGEFTSGCDASAYGDGSRVKDLYSMLIFNRQDGSETERTRYSTEMYALIRTMAHDFAMRTELASSPDEVENFVRSIMAVAQQETYWSHYRTGLTDGRLKIATGDSQDSHGMMQINQKYQGAKGRDNSFDLVGNIELGIEYYYAGYKRAESISCVKSKKNTKGVNQTKYLEMKSRAAYSAYNGGPGAICRWAKRKSEWAENDSHFYDKYVNQEWLQYVSDIHMPAHVRADCLINGDDLCALPASTRDLYVHERPVAMSDGQTCIWQNGEFRCASDIRTFYCLGISSEVLTRNPILIPGGSDLDKSLVRSPVKNRDQLCHETNPGLIDVGSFLRVKASGKLVRNEIMGEQVLQKTQAGAVYQVLDYQIRMGDSQRLERFYKIRLDNKKEGYIFGGDTQSYASFAEKVEANPAVTKSVLPVAGSFVMAAPKNTSKDGSSLRFLYSPDSNSPDQGRIPVGTRLKILKIVVLQNSENLIYLAIEFGGKSGYVYAGHTLPEVTFSDYFKVVK